MVFIAFLLVLVGSVLYTGHKKVSAESLARVNRIYDDQIKLARTARLETHWLFKTHFPQTFKFTENDTREHEVKWIEYSRKIFNERV